MTFKSCLASAAFAVGVLGATAASSAITTLQLNGSILQRSDQTSSLALQVPLAEVPRLKMSPIGTCR